MSLRTLHCIRRTASRGFCSHLQPATRNLPIFTSTRQPPHWVVIHTSTRTQHIMAPSKEEKDAATSKGNNQEDVEGKENEWKFRAPYKIHDDAKGFNALYEASCHCGRVRYQLSREKPLDAKYCHCNTCQRLHGKHSILTWCAGNVLCDRSLTCLCRCSLPMGRYIRENGHQLHPRSS